MDRWREKEKRKRGEKCGGGEGREMQCSEEKTGNRRDKGGEGMEQAVEGI